ncbi:hypothetical protein Nepgr_016880 [Nepenthes gracilis]|uniref:Uncharacterized protein n=1 Tax=Nepenthes gracilis TaxID=150966 RepID=A0AAD3SQH9_NEPGR|nr:hypothetical protein Nepgr_016880 [Nepenthes gracilis]
MASELIVIFYGSFWLRLIFSRGLIASKYFQLRSPNICYYQLGTLKEHKEAGPHEIFSELLEDHFRTLETLLLKPFSIRHLYMLFHEVISMQQRRHTQGP